MTIYEMIEAMIVKKVVTLDTLKKLVFDAYYHSKIDGFEYEELIKLGEKRL